MLKQSERESGRGGRVAATTTFNKAQQRRNCLRSPAVTSGSLTASPLRLLICCTALLLLVFATVVVADEMVSSQPRVPFKNEEFLNRRKFPDVQGVLQKSSSNENLNMFLMILKNTLVDSGYTPSSGKSVSYVHICPPLPS